MRFFARLLGAWLAGALIVSLSAAAQAPRASRAGTAVTFHAQCHPGETARYTFSARMSTTPLVNTQAAAPSTLQTVPRRYELRGEMVAAFAATPPGQPLVGTVRFENLRVEHWQSSSDVSGLEALLKKLQQSPLMLTTAAGGGFDLTGAPQTAPGDPLASDLVTLEDLARSALVTQLAPAPLTPGERHGNPGYPIRGVITPGLQYMSETRYVRNVAIAGRPAAELRLSLQFPRQAMPAALASAQELDDPYLRFQYLLEGTNSLTYLFDAAARQVIDLHAFQHGRMSVVVRNTDTGAAVRIPVTVLRVDHDAEISLRRVSAAPSPERQADLAAFEKSLQAAAGAAQPSAQAPFPGGGETLGALARRMRAERQAEREAAKEAAAAAAGPPAAPAVPPGFQTYTYPNSRLTVLVPSENIVLRGRENVVTLVGRTASGQPSVTILLAQRPFPAGIAASEAVETVANSMLEMFPGHQVLKGETRNFQGNSGKVLEFRYTEAAGGAQHAWMGVAALGAQVSAVACSAPQAGYAQASTTCLTVVESLRAP
jgi:hypothetical protein